MARCHVVPCRGAHSAEAWDVPGNGMCGLQHVLCVEGTSVCPVQQALAVSVRRSDSSYRGREPTQLVSASASLDLWHKRIRLWRWMLTSKDHGLGACLLSRYSLIRGVGFLRIR